MAEQQLDGPDVGAGFQEMYGKGVPQTVRGDWFGNPAPSFAKIATVVRQVGVDPELQTMARTIQGIDDRSTAVAPMSVPADAPSVRRPIDSARQAARRS
jgi:hypothetical protein